MLLEVGGFHRVVRRAEINRAGNDLLLAATGSDRLVVDACTGFLLILRCPLCIDGERKRCTGTGDVGGLSRQRGCRKRHTDGKLFEYAFEHEGVPFEEP